MQFYAFDGEQLVLASHAFRQKNYFCPECRSPVRLRFGPQRQPHFYHLSPPASCKQHSKGAAHLQIQWRLYSLLTPAESSMERPFPEVGRIADVAWEARKIVFEIQCSPISLAEVEARCQDYLSAGFTPIWILHENRFNKRRLSGAENFLHKTFVYYTDIDEKGHGEIYDQFDICLKNRRLFRGPPLPIDPKKPYAIEAEAEENFPQAICKRLTERRLIFSGDLVDRLLQDSHAGQGMKIMEKRFFQPPPRRTLWKKIVGTYEVLLKIALEKACLGKR